MGGFGGHVAAMIASYNFNRGKLKRREKRDASLYVHGKVPINRRPIRSNLTKLEIQKIKQRQLRISIKKRNWNRLILFPVTLVATVCVLFVFYHGLIRLNDVMKIEKPPPSEIHVYEHNPSYIPIELDYSPLEKE